MPVDTGAVTVVNARGLWCRAAGVGLLVLPVLLISVLASAADAPATLERLNAQQRLKLERDQKAYEQSRVPLSEEQRRRLEEHLDAQRQAQRRLQQQQLRQERALQKQLAPESPAVSRHLMNEQLERDRRRQDRQSLQFELDRKSWPYPRR